MLEFTSKEVLLSIINSFWQSCDSLLEEIDLAISENNTSLLSSTAHALKGASANVGASKLAKITAYLQHASIEEASIYLKLVPSTIQETKQALEQALES